MNRAEAVQLAVNFMSKESEYSIDLTPSDAFLVQAAKYPDRYTNDFWVVHFPIRLPPEVLFQEPSTVIVQVDAITSEVTIFPAL